MELEALDETWDLIVIGGGITGAGVFREAIRCGFKTLLIEEKDYAWGTSSRSSKLVHGGLRYLREGRLMLTRESVKERERLLHDARGLVEPIDFIFPVFKHHGPGKWTMKAGLAIYDMLAGTWRHRYHNKKMMTKLEPLIDENNLIGGFSFMDAQTDDARLVIRLILDGVENGGTALNYTYAESIVKNRSGKVSGVLATQGETNEQRTFFAGAVINATGVKVENLHSPPVGRRRIRPLRGSHLIFPKELIPLSYPISFFNPEDKRPLFAIPWEGVVLVGTTDIDHDQDMSLEPRISPDEASYIIKAVKMLFPTINIELSDCISTFAGIRPVLSEGKLEASKETREHDVWVDNGLVTVTGGKLTTFRAIAWTTLKAAKPFLPNLQIKKRREPLFSLPDMADIKREDLSESEINRLYGRYGRHAASILSHPNKELIRKIPGTNTLWAELYHVAKCEHVRHLDDLMLRRVRIGNILENGGQQYLKKIQEICQQELGWDDSKWEDEAETYLRLWKKYYSLSQ